MRLDEKRVIKAKTFIPDNPELTDAKIRVRPLLDQGVDESLRIECPRKIRKDYPVGTVFEMKVKMCQRESGANFLYNHYSWHMKPLS